MTSLQQKLQHAARADKMRYLGLNPEEEFAREAGEAAADAVLARYTEAAVAAERERCAKIAEAHAEEMLGIETGGLYCGCGEDIAAKIRSGE